MSLAVAPVAIMPSGLVMFVTGVTAARYAWRPAPRLAALSAEAALALVIAVALSPWRHLIIERLQATDPIFGYNLYFCAVIALVTAPFAIWTMHQRSDPTDRMCGDLSYIIYLFHWMAVQSLSALHGSALLQLSAVVACVLSVGAVSWLIWRYVDRPLNIRRARWMDQQLRPHHVGANAAMEPAIP